MPKLWAYSGFRHENDTKYFKVCRRKSGNRILSQELLLTGICKECRKKEKI